MLTSIHPLGERARNNRWWLTAVAFLVGSAATAAAIGGFLGAVGRVALPDLSNTAGPIVVVAAAALDLAGVAVPGPHRQVNERWIGTFRGWVYGSAFGAQLGAGVTTYIVTWLVPATLAVEVATRSATAGALVGIAFGVGRALPVLAAGWIDRPSRLRSVSRTMATIARPAFVALPAAAGALAISVVIAGWV
jgi:sulfite exporter TauE/SafE